MALTTLPRPCWVLRLPDGSKLYEEGDSHHSTREQAEAAIRYGDPTEPRVTEQHPEQLRYPCAQLTCTDCGTLADEDGDEGEIHFASYEEAVTWAQRNDWRSTLTSDDDLCPYCPNRETPRTPGPLDQPIPGLEPR